MKTVKVSKDIEIKTEIEVEIEMSDVLEFINYAGKDELDEIREAIGGDAESKFDTAHLVGNEKLELLSIAANKFTLEELEQRLGGTKFTL